MSSVLLSEMQEQSGLAQRLVASPSPVLDEIVRSLREAPPRAIVLVARGSSDHAAIYGRYLFEIRNRALTSLAAPSAFTVYESGPELRDTLVIGVSQSGQGEDVTSVIRAANEMGARTVALVNDGSSPLAEAAHWVLELGAGPERSVPATKTVLTQMLWLARLSSAWRGADADAESLGRLPEAISAAVAQVDPAQNLARLLAHVEHLSVVGRGFAYPVAMELALKLEEMAHVHASAFSSADFFHGPVTLLGPAHRGIVLDAGERSTAGALETARAFERRGAEASLIRAGRFAGFRDAPALSSACDLDEHHAALVLLVLGQRLAYEVALARGVDPSSPPGLRKVTSTR